MSLADELLADLEAEGMLTEDGERDMSADTSAYAEAAGVLDGSANGHIPSPNDNHENKTPSIARKGAASSMATVKDVAPLGTGTKLPQLLERMKAAQTEYMSPSSQQQVQSEVEGPMETDPEYQLVVEANNMAVEIDNEINIVYKFVRDRYCRRFPELEPLIKDQQQYIRAVRVIGNDIRNVSTNENLALILPPATIMIVSLTASSSYGKPLAEHDLGVVMEGCDVAEKLESAKQAIYSFVESRMSYIAPNLSAIIGASLAAKLVGVAGGLTELSRIPAANVQLLGGQKRSLTGFSHASVTPHTGLIYHSKMVQSLPKDFRRQASRLIAAKCTLAARIDACHQSRDGVQGQRLHEEVEKKIEKWLEPASVKQVKALPAPIETVRKRRGGRRVRKMKERTGMTDMRRAANRMNFGELEEDAYQDDLGFSAGHLSNKAAKGKIRAPQVDTKTQVRVSKALQKKLNVQNSGWGTSTSIRKQLSGTASSIAFTPVQGLEIVNPLAAAERSGTASNKYFSSTGTFTQISTKKNMKVFS